MDEVYLNMLGYISCKLLREDGSEFEIHRQNVVVDSALNRLGYLLYYGNVASNTAITSLKIGNSTVFFSKPETQKDLIRPVLEVDLFQKTYLAETYDGKLVPSTVKTNKVSYRFKIDMYALPNTVNVTEMGLFTGDGTMFSYKVLDASDVFEKRINDVLLVDWVVILYNVTGQVSNQNAIIYDEFWIKEKINPVNLSLDKLSSSGVYLKWNQVSDPHLAAYNVCRRSWDSINDVWMDYVMVGEVFTQTGDVISLYKEPHAFVDESFEFGNLYAYNMKLLNQSGVEGDFGDDLIVPTIDLRAYGRNKKIELFWDAVDWNDLGGYNIYQYLAYEQYLFIKSSDTNMVILESSAILEIVNGQSYEFVVRAFNKDGVEYTDSTRTYVIPHENVPLAPTIESGKAGDGSVTLIWDVVNGVNNYDLYRVFPSGISGVSGSSGLVYSFMSHLNISNYASYASGMLKAMISGLNNGEIYDFALRSVDNDLEISELGNFVSIMPVATELRAVSNLTATGKFESILLQWGGVDGARNYDLYWMFNDEWNILTTTKDTFALINGLVNGTDYVFKVVAIDYNGKYGEESLWVAGTPIDSAMPEIPQNLIYEISDLDLTHKLISLSWDMYFEPDFKYFNVYGGGGDLGDFALITDVFLNGFSRVGIVGDTYTFSVTMVNTSDHESNYSNEVVVILE